MEIPAYANLTTEFEVNYLYNIRSNSDFNLHLLRESKILLMRNCNEDASLCSLQAPKSAYAKIKPWTLLFIRTFKDEVRHCSARNHC